MTTDTQLAPTDAEIKDLYAQETGFILDESPAALLDFARAVLTKWGQPAHSGEPVAWLSPWRADQVTTDYDAYGKHGIPLYTAPQPSPTAQSADSVQKDAARYRWLRDTSNADDPSHMIALHIREEQNDASLSGIDAAIDAALAAQRDTP